MVRLAPSKIARALPGFIVNHQQIVDLSERSARAINMRPQRSGAESPIAPNSAFPCPVWNEPGPSDSAVSSEKRFAARSHPSSYSKLALSWPLRARPQPPAKLLRSVQTDIHIDQLVHLFARLMRFINVNVSAYRRSEIAWIAPGQMLVGASSIKAFPKQIRHPLPTSE
jgi:hypothetical protein